MHPYPPRRGPENKILPLLAVDAFLVGLAFGLLYNTGYTLLVYRFGSGGLRLAYVMAGLLVPIVSIGFQSLEERISVFRLSAATKLVFAVAAPLLYALTFPLFGRVAALAPFFIMLVYTMGALYCFMLRGSIAAELYDVRTLKGVYPRLTAWEMTAVICAGLAVAPLSRILGAVEAILPLSGIALIGSLAVGRRVRRTIGSNGRDRTPASEQHSNQTHSVIGSLRTLLSNRYAMLVFLYQFLAFSTSLLLQYVIYTQAQRVFATQDGLTQFIGLAKSLVTAGAMLFTFLAAGYLLLRYGMLAGLGVGPMLITLGIVVSLVAGAFGVSPQVFLGILVLIQVLEYGSYSGFAKTSVQSAFQPLAAHEREAVHGFAQGIGIPLSYGFSGLVLIGLSRLDSADGYYAIAVTLVITLAYGAVGWLLFRAYGEQLRSSLARRRIDGVNLVFNDASTREVLHRLLDTPDRWQVHAALDLMHEAGMPDYEPCVRELIASPHPGVQAEAFARVEELRSEWAEPMARNAACGDNPIEVRQAAVCAWCATSQDPVLEVAPLLSAGEPEIRAAAVTGLFLYGGINGILHAGNVFNTMVESPDPADRRHAADILGRLAVRSFYQPLIPLLRDENTEVRLAALRAVRSVGHPALLAETIELTEPAATRAEALAALAGMGEAVLPELTRIVHDRSILPKHTCVRIVRASGRMEPVRVTSVLTEGLGRPADELTTAILQALVARSYRADAAARPQILLAIDLRLANAALAVMALHDLRADSIALRALISAAQDSYVRSVEDAFLLLSLLHSQDEVQGARRRMLEGTLRDRALAAELLDVTLTGPLRQKMLAVTEHRDDSPPEIEKYRELFGLRALGNNNRVLQMASDSRLWPEQWPRICGRAAAWALGLGQTKPEDSVLTTIERVLALKTAEIFAGIPDAVLAHIASIVEEIDVAPRETFIRKGEFGSCMYTIREGRVLIHDGDRRFAELGPGEVVGEMAVLDPQPRSASVTALENTVLLRLDKDAFDSVMADHPSLAQGVIAVLCRRLRSGLQDG